jgi:cellulose synthase/poly-beta-1,6-N-acetylglucosamine synthase-like glycosyltransferase
MYLVFTLFWDHLTKKFYLQGWDKMFRRKVNPHNSMKFKKRKMFPKDLPQEGVKSNINLSKWIFVLIFLIIIFGIIVIFLISVNSYLKIIVGYSLTGFLTFFMAYFGWILAKVVIDKVTVNNQKNVNGVLYYFKKLRKNNE